ncbi:MAG: hypothetical protein BWZ02_03081 [Lentisphaerae bacterium ADurb.BinA184]|nr:MAG: hypothetical protein BWZ02_03081 [Lentisphaerae bacterium ADurb.BinA184]
MNFISRLCSLTLRWAVRRMDLARVSFSWARPLSARVISRRTRGMLSLCGPRRGGRGGGASPSSPSPSSGPAAPVGARRVTRPQSWYFSNWMTTSSPVWMPSESSSSQSYFSPGPAVT